MYFLSQGLRRWRKHRKTEPRDSDLIGIKELELQRWNSIVVFLEVVRFSGGIRRYHRFLLTIEQCLADSQTQDLLPSVVLSLGRFCEGSEFLPAQRRRTVPLRP
jgi:hypothetical protein